MDSPIFGNQKSHKHPKIQKVTEYTTNASDFNSSDWYISNKSDSNNQNSQISTDLKLAYTLLVV